MPIFLKIMSLSLMAYFNTFGNCDTLAHGLSFNDLDSLIRKYASSDKIQRCCYIDTSCAKCYHKGDFDGDGLCDIVITIKRLTHNGLLFIMGNSNKFLFGAGADTPVTHIFDKESEKLLFKDEDFDNIYHWSVLHSKMKAGVNKVIFTGPIINKVLEISAPGIKGDGLLLDYEDVYYLLYSDGLKWYFFNLGF